MPPNAIGLKVMQSQLSTMQNNRDLHEVDASHGGFANACSAKAFGRALSKCRSLARLKLRHCSIGPKVCTALWEGGSPSALCELDLSSNPNLCYCAKLLSVMRAPTLTKLTLLDCGISAEKARMLIGSLSSGLQELDLSVNKLGDANPTFDQLGSTMIPSGALSSMMTLRLSDCGIGPAGCSALCAHVSRSLNLRELDLSSNSIGEEGCSSLASALRESKTLSKIVLYKCNIGPAACGALCASAQESSSLSHLQIQQNPIGNDGAQHIGQLIRRSHTLTTLNIWGAKLGSEGCRAVCAGVTASTSLTELNLQMNYIADCGAAWVADMIRGGCKCKKIQLDQCSIGDKGCADLCDAIVSPNATSLTELTLQRNRIGDVGHQFFSDARRRNSVLSKLDLTDNDMTAEVEATLFRAVSDVGGSRGTRFHKMSDSPLDASDSIQGMILRSTPPEREGDCVMEEAVGGGKAGAEGGGAIEQTCPSRVSESCAPESGARESADGMRKRVWKHEIGEDERLGAVDCSTQKRRKGLLSHVSAHNSSGEGCSLKSPARPSTIFKVGGVAREATGRCSSPQQVSCEQEPARRSPMVGANGCTPVAEEASSQKQALELKDRCVKALEEQIEELKREKMEAEEEHHQELLWQIMATDALHAKVDDLAGLALSAGADAAAVRAIKDRSLARGQCT